MRFTSFLAALSLSLLLTLPTLAEATLKATIDIAGRQRMLTQKMSKELLLLHLGINPEENAKNLLATSNLFENSFHNIIIGTDTIQGVRDDASFQNLSNVQAIWKNFSILNQDAADKKTASRGHIALLSALNLPLLKKSNTAVQSIAQSAGDSGITPKLSNTINLAGRQRMFSQKMSKEFLFILSDYKTTHYRNQLNKTYALFDKTLTSLQNGNNAQKIIAPPNNQLAAQLTTVANIWDNFKRPLKKAINGQALTQADKNIVISQNIPLLKEMNKAVKMYTR